MLARLQAVLHHAHALDLVVTDAWARIGCIARRHAIGVYSFSDDTGLLTDRWHHEIVASWRRSLRGHVVSLQVYSGIPHYAMMILQADNPGVSIHSANVKG